MRIAAFQRRRWPEAVRRAGYECVALPQPPNCWYFESTLDDLIAHGKVVREILERNPVDFIIDAHGDGMLFIDDPREVGPEALLHHQLGIPLFSHWTETLRILFKKIDSVLLHAMFQHPTWHKGVCMRGHLAEMQWMGIPNCMHLPLAADVAEYPVDTPIVDRDGPVVFFAGSQQSQYFAHADGADTRLQRAGALALASVTDGSADSFLDVYRRMNVGPQAAPDADATTRAECMQTYYAHKLFFCAARNLANRDRFVIALAQRLGERFRFVGDERWRDMYDLSPGKRISDEAYIDAIRRTPISLNLVNGDNDTGLNQRSYEITAWGGLLLHHRQPELGELYEIGEECVAFRNEPELFDRIHYLVEHPARRDEIAHAGQQRTLRCHLLHHRVETIVRHLRSEGVI